MKPYIPIITILFAFAILISPWESKVLGREVLYLNISEVILFSLGLYCGKWIEQSYKKPEMGR